MIKDGIRINIIVMNKEQSLFKAFYNAWKGLQYFFLHDRNGRVHLGAAIATILAGIILKVTYLEWVAIFICIALVIAAEMINAAIEKLCDMVHKDYHPGIKIIKDISAGAVLFIAAISMVMGAIIFLPKIIELL